MVLGGQGGEAGGQGLPFFSFLPVCSAMAVFRVVAGSWPDT